jgi:uncharacterized protein (DUF1501 family)
MQDAHGHISNRAERSGCDEYHALSRRSVLRAVLGAATIPLWLPRVSVARDYRGGAKDALVVVYLRGGADGMTMCVPHAENAYYAARPLLNVPRPDSTSSNRCTNLDGFFGLPPALVPLMEPYSAGKLLMVHACGSMDFSRSHFDAQRSMEVGKVQDLSLSTGWLGRHLSTVAPQVLGAQLRAVAMARGLPIALWGGPGALPIPDLSGFGLRGRSQTETARRAAIQTMYAGTQNALAQSAATSLATLDLLDAIGFESYVPAGGATYGTDSFGLAMKSAAALVKAQVGVEAITVDLGGWDTHAVQGNFTGEMAVKMQTLASGLLAFYRDVVAQSGPRAVVLVMSEFGRRLKENASQGTDHGIAGTMMLMGQAVLGGRVHANWPGIDAGDLVNGIDLAVTTDYRDVVGEVLRLRCGNEQLQSVFPGFNVGSPGVVLP